MQKYVIFGYMSAMVYSSFNILQLYMSVRVYSFFTILLLYAKVCDVSLDLSYQSSTNMLLILMQVLMTYFLPHQSNTDESNSTSI